MKKLLCLLMTAVLLLSTVAVTFHAAEVDRTNEGAAFEVADAGADVDVAQTGNPYPTTQNVDGDGYYEVPCTRFAWQQAYDRLGISLPGWGNAVNWWQGAINAGYSTGSTPQPESIAVWSGDYYGHVAYVTSVSGGNTFTVNEGGRTDLDHTDSHGIAYGYTLTNAVGASRPYDAGKTLLGFIYLNGKSGLNIGDDFYALILNGPAWKPIGQTDSGNVEIMTESKTNYNRTLWHFVRRDDKNAYRIYNMLNGKCLDVQNASSAEDANVQCWAANDSQAQYWYYQAKGDSGALTAGCTSMYLDMDGGSTGDGTNIQMWSWNGTNAQKFAYYQVTPGACALNHTITAKSSKIDAGDSTEITVGGTLNYVYNYKFHVVGPDNKEKVVDNGCNPTLSFKPQDEGIYSIYAEIKNPYNTQKGSANSDRCVTITVGCAHTYSEKFVEAAAEGGQGYVLYTCTKCGKTYKDNYMKLQDGWYYPVDETKTIPACIKDNDKYTFEYNNFFEKVQKDSPGVGWVKGKTVKNEWVNKGGQYESYSPLPTSDSRVLVREYYYHYCIPGSSMGSEGNYEQTDYYTHYDEIALPNDSIVVRWTGDDNGHTAYVLTWGSSGPDVYCKSGEQCDGSWGYHDYRCRAWYKKYVYQDKERVELYKWTKDSGWIGAPDSSADKTTVRFQANVDPIILGDADGDGEVTTLDATLIRRYCASMEVKIDEDVLMNGDVDGDGWVSVIDATFIQRHLAFMDTKYPIGEIKE